MKIAIIGSGVSGLSSAYLLSPHHEVTIYEKDNRIGGHAHTYELTEGANKISVDNGFMVFNPKQYPSFIGLLNQLGIEGVNTEMTFGVHIPDTVDFNGKFFNGVFAERSNLFNVRYLKFLGQIVKFRKLAKKELAKNPTGKENLGDFLDRNNLSQDFRNWYLYPQLSAIWSIKQAQESKDFPAISTFRFLDNHRLLNNFQPQWKTLKGGSIEYVKKLEKSIAENGAKILLKQKIKTVQRKEESITVRTSTGSRDYDYVIFATHANTTLKLLTEPTKIEKQALGMFEYTTNKTILHKDINVLPKNRRVVGAWNYLQETSDVNSPAIFTYNMNILQHIPEKTPVFVTLNPLIDIPKDKVYAVETYEHPKYTLKSLSAQEQISSIQGENRTYFTGAHLGFGFHEDGVASAVNVAKLLGVEAPWNLS